MDWPEVLCPAADESCMIDENLLAYTADNPDFEAHMVVGEPQNSIERRLRHLELEFARWQPTVDSELRAARETRLKYIPILEELMSEDRLEKALTVALNNTQTQAWTRRERVMGLAAFVVLLLNLAITLYLVL